MPYSKIEELPPAVKKLPEKRQRQWMHVWNSAFESCQSSGGSKCEGSAFSQAWGTVRKSLEEEDYLILKEDMLIPVPLTPEFIASVDAPWLLEIEKSTASINDLPDSAFAYIESGGEKDDSGKTTPRSLRHFPIHDKAHAQNALARMNQSPFGEKAKPKILAAARRFGIELNPDRWKSEEGKVDMLVKLAGSLQQGIVYGIVYEPDTVDSQGDFASAEEIEKAAHSFLPEAVMNLNHSEDLEDVQVVESYIAPCDFFIEQQMVRKGSWVLVTKILNEDLKKAILEGEITAYSLEGTASRFDYAGI